MKKSIPIFNVSLNINSLRLFKSLSDCSVVKTKLGEHSLILGAEVDCQTDDKVPNDPARNYVELKTSKIITNEREMRNFEKFKLIKFYFQSFLIGVPKSTLYAIVEVILLY